MVCLGPTHEGCCLWFWVLSDGYRPDWTKPAQAQACPSCSPDFVQALEHDFPSGPSPTHLVCNINEQGTKHYVQLDDWQLVLCKI